MIEFHLSACGSFIWKPKPLAFWLIKAEYQGFQMRYITFLYDNWFLSNRAKIAELLFTGPIFSCLSVHWGQKRSDRARFFKANFEGFWQFSQEVLDTSKIQSRTICKWYIRSRFFEANFDGFWQFSQKVFKIQKFYIPCWKALVFSFQKLYQHRVWLSPKNRYTPLNESQTVFTKKGVADK